MDGSQKIQNGIQATKIRKHDKDGNKTKTTEQAEATADYLTSRQWEKNGQ